MNVPALKLNGINGATQIENAAQKTNGEKSPRFVVKDSLLQLFQCPYFDTWLTVWYLNKYASQPGVYDYLCNNLYSKPIEEVQFHLPQLLVLLLTGNHTESLERFILDKCAESMHFAFCTLLQLQALIESASGPAPSAATSAAHCNQIQIRRCLRLHELVEVAAVNGPDAHNGKVTLPSRQPSRSRSWESQQPSNSAPASPSLSSTLPTSFSSPSLCSLDAPPATGHQEPAASSSSSSSSQLGASNPQTSADSTSPRSLWSSLFSWGPLASAPTTPASSTPNSPQPAPDRSAASEGVRPVSPRSAAVAAAAASEPQLRVKKKRKRTRRSRRITDLGANDGNDDDDNATVPVANDEPVASRATASVDNGDGPESVGEEYGGDPDDHSNVRANGANDVADDEEKKNELKLKEQRDLDYARFASVGDSMESEMETSFVTNVLSKRMRSEFFDNVTNFTAALVEVSARVMAVPPPQRQQRLRQQIEEIDRNLPVLGLYIPVDEINKPYSCIVRLLPQESFLLDSNSREHASYIIYFETIESDCDCSSKGIHLVNPKKKLHSSCPSSPIIDRKADHEQEEADKKNEGEQETKDGNGDAPVNDNEFHTGNTKNDNNGEGLASKQAGESSDRSSESTIEDNENKAIAVEEQKQDPPIQEPTAVISNQQQQQQQRDLAPDNDVTEDDDAAPFPGIPLHSMAKPPPRIKVSAEHAAIIDEADKEAWVLLKNGDNHSSSSSSSRLGSATPKDESKSNNNNAQADESEGSSMSRALAAVEPHAAFAEDWAAKSKRIRAASPYKDFPNWRLRSMIIKYDECQQEVLASQLITQFKKIFDAADLPLPLHPIKVLVVSQKCGIIETIPDAVSLHQIRKDPNVKCLLDYFKKHYPTGHAFKEGQINFCRSLAAYSIVTYLLQVKDRHNGNILLTRGGFVIHIDFGYFLSNSPRSLNFESAPFKLTQEFVDIMGGVESDTFEYYKSLCIAGFLEARKHMEKIIMPVEFAMKGPYLPCFMGGDSLLDGLRERFQRGLTEEQCVEHVRGLIHASLDNWRTLSYDKYQYLTRGILY